MVPMGALQPGIPSPIAIPKGYVKLVIDLKDCFFSIPLHPDDCKRFAFSIPITNCVGPSPRFQWRVLPQGMANSPTLCQKFVAQTIDPFRLLFPTLYIIHYMDDILLAGPDQQQLYAASQQLVTALRDRGLQISPEKVQVHPPQLFLGFELFSNKILTQKIQLKRSSLNTLNDFQRLLGDINWLRPYLKLTTGELKPLFDVLRGDPDPSSPRSLSSEAQRALTIVERAISEQTISYFSPHLSLWLLIFPTPFSPTGVLWQNHPLFWVHLPASPPRVLATYPQLVAALLRLGREAALKLFGRDPEVITLPYNTSQLQWLIQHDDDWAISCTSFQGTIDNHYPADRLVQFLQKTPVVFPKRTKTTPIAGAVMVFSDGSSSGIAAFSINGQVTRIQTDLSSAQLVELTAIIKVFELLIDAPFNLYTDSAYVATSVPLLETVPYIRPSTNASPLFAKLQRLILSRDAPFFIGHIRAHSGLPGPLAKGNDRVDLATQLVASVTSDSPLAAAQRAHELHHLNAHTLRLKFSITREQPAK